MRHRGPIRAAADPLARPPQTERAFQKQEGVNVGCVRHHACRPRAVAPLAGAAHPLGLGLQLPRGAAGSGCRCTRACPGLGSIATHPPRPPDARSSPLQLQEARQEDPRQGRSALLQERRPGLQDPQGGHRGCVLCCAETARRLVAPLVRGVARFRTHRSLPLNAPVLALSQATTSTRSAPSPAMCPSAAVSSAVRRRCTPPARCSEQRAATHAGTQQQRITRAAAWPAGTVKSTKMTRTIVVRRDYLHYVKKYARCVAAAGAGRLQARARAQANGGQR